MAYPDIDKIDTELRHALGILDLMMDNIGHHVDSSTDSMEYALWSATKHLKGALHEIEDTGERNLSELLSRVDPNPFGEDEEGEDDEEEIFVATIAIKKDGTISLLKDEDK